MDKVPFKVFVITHRPRGEPDCERKEVSSDVFIAAKAAGYCIVIEESVIRVYEVDDMVDYTIVKVYVFDHHNEMEVAVYEAQLDS